MRTIGTVSWYNDSKGYGFIKTGNHTDVFVHYSNLGDGTKVGALKTLSQDQSVEFDLIEGPKGPQAANVLPKIKD